MKYMILTYASQQDYDGMAGKPTDRPAWSAEDFAAMGEFMESFNKDLADSGELVETRALAAPVLTRRLQLQNGVPVVTDGPYAETQEVLAGYWIVESESFDRATEIAGRGRRERRGGRPAARRLPDRSGAVTASVPDTEAEGLLRRLAPQVLGAVVRRYTHFDTAEDAVQEALLAAAMQWPKDGIPDNPRGWLITVASRRLTDLLRASRRASAARTASPDGPFPSRGWRPPPTGRRRGPTTRSSCCPCAVTPSCHRHRRSR